MKTPTNEELAQAVLTIIANNDDDLYLKDLDTLRVVADRLESIAKAQRYAMISYGPTTGIYENDAGDYVRYEDVNP